MKGKPLRGKQKAKGKSESALREQSHFIFAF
jgi:hypothetical protein